MRARILRRAVVIALLAAPAAASPRTPVLDHREQAPLVRRWILQRFETLLPQLMRRERIDMWIVVSREYNDDPVFRSMSPLTTYASRRRTILVFHDRGAQGVDRLSIGRFDYDGLYTLVRTSNEDQWEGLRQLVIARDPKVIGIDMSDAFAHADGLSATEHENLVEALGPKYAARVRSAERLVVGWLERKLPEETTAYRHVMRVAHDVIAGAFSNEVIVPGVTTTEDVAWWMRQHVANHGLGGWFQPSITIWRKGGLPPDTPPEKRIIQPGDMLHTDFGLVYLLFATDTQHLAYVLRPGEADAPAGLKAGLRAANRLQELTMKHARVGVTGNQALKAALEEARAEGLAPSIYCHPIGYHGHAAGPPIGMIDYQQGVPVRGDYTFSADTWHSIELNARVNVPEWNNQEVSFSLEEDAVLFEHGWEWIDGRQTEFYLIK
jgi:Xaa-Pro aminopeptidase